MKRYLVGAALVVVLAACQEQLSSPADCPALCPRWHRPSDRHRPQPHHGSRQHLRRLRPPLNGGSTLITTGLPFQARGVIRFTSIPDSVTIGSTKRAYTIDSVAVNIAVAERDTAAKPGALLFYRIQSRPDTSYTYAEAVAAEAGGVTITLRSRTRSGRVPRAWCSRGRRSRRSRFPRSIPAARRSSSASARRPPTGVACSTRRPRTTSGM